uniref:non-specific serine/threonine protein kinase n=2 Tax=Litorilinea aerophila TaxID=1204385 RepID=A0A540VKK0_9CHLR
MFYASVMGSPPPGQEIPLAGPATACCQPFLLTLNGVFMDFTSNELGSSDPDAERDSGAGRTDAERKPAPGPSSTFLPGANLTGQQIGHYLVEERLGGGVMSTVYRARDQILERTVALKVLMPGADEVARERFRREARTVSFLEHPHIVRTYQVGQTGADGLIYIAMQLVEGFSLSTLLERHGKLCVVDACNLLEPIARALAYAHRHGVIHRDVKPGNILLHRVPPGTPHSVQLTILDTPVIPLLTDFGIARALDAPELTSVGRTIGTPAFMSPEQCAGRSDIDGRADIYSLGAVLYRCLVGRIPFTGSTTQILHAHVYEPLLIPDQVSRTLPLVVAETLRRSMMKDPAERYPNAELMADDLALGAGRQVEPSPASLELDPDEMTQTLEVAPVTQPVDSGGTVLVPARSPGGPPSGVRPRPPVGEPIPSPSPRPVPRSRRAVLTRRLGMGVLSTAVVLLLVFLSISLFNSVFNSLGEDGLAQSPTATRPLGSQAGPGTPQAPPAGAVSLSPTPSAQTPPTVGAASSPTDPPATVAAGSPITATAVATPPPDVTPTPIPTPAASLASAWDDAQAFYAEQDWAEALSWLTIVRRIDPSFQQEQVTAMMVDSYLGLAAQANGEGQPEVALDYLDEALALQEDDILLLRLRTATAQFLEAQATPPPSVEEMELIRRSLQQAHAAYGDKLAESQKPCAAIEQVTAANRILPDPKLSEKLADYQAQCDTVKAIAAVSQLGGHLIYSAYQNERYRIFRMPVAYDAPSTLLVENGTQPSLRPDGRVIAFYSLRADYQGLSGFDLNAGLDPNDRSVRYTDFVEDSRDSPPSWSPDGSRLVYASMSFGDGRSRIYVVPADGSRRATTLALGKDPAWHPSDDWIVYNGTDETGNNPGLWLMHSDGTGRTRLTDNGNDQRPTWSPDGRYVVFMSNGRDGNWEVYRVDLLDGSILRLTSHPAQDGLPTVSPDSKYVAFLSDRDGYWRIYYVPINGGPVRPLSRMAGELPKWLEYAIQWVN